MQLEESFELAFPRDAVWAAFKDVPLLVSCLPGASLRSAPGAEPIELVFAVKLGPITARFVGEGSVCYAEDYTGRISGSGADRATNSRVKGAAAFALLAEAESTRVVTRIDYTLTGALAQVGRAGIVKEIAARLTRQFAENLQARIGERMGSASPAGMTGSRVPHAHVPKEESRPVDGGALVWDVVLGRLKKRKG
ncbi:MAG TPA: SRPBCC family protein [Sandaracinaceae bacterium]